MTNEQEYANWVSNGKSIPAPDYARTLAVASLASKFGISTFVETGTLVGSRIAAVMGLFDELHSIELSDELFKRCSDRFWGISKVHLYQGDSGKILPSILPNLSRPCLFFLDAHYSAGLTARGEESSALKEELAAIANHIKDYDDVVLVDDTYDMQDADGYVSVQTATDTILAVRPDYTSCVDDYILRIFPRS